jgi:hypothetical protein
MWRSMRVKSVGNWLSNTTYGDVIHGLWCGATELTGSHDDIVRSATSWSQ